MEATPFSLVYDSFFSKITDDMYLELTELDTYRMLEPLLYSAIQKFEFPRIDLNDYEIFEVEDVRTYSGVESNYIPVQAILYTGGEFCNCLTQEEINILAVYMIVEWLSQQLASVQNTRMKYSGSDFKFTSQASHMQKLLQIKKDYERQGFHLQRLYKRRKRDQYGIMRSTLHVLREPMKYENTNNKSEIQDFHKLIVIYEGGNASLSYDAIYDGGDSARGEYDSTYDIIYDGGNAFNQ